MENIKMNKNAQLPLPVELPEAEISDKLSAEIIEFFKKEYLDTHKQLNDKYNAKELKDNKYLKLIKNAKKQYIKGVNGTFVNKVSKKHKQGKENLLTNKYAFERYVSWRKKNEAITEINAKIKQLKNNFNAEGSYKKTKEYEELAAQVKAVKEKYRNEVEMQRKAFNQAVDNTEPNKCARWFNKLWGSWKAYIHTGGGVINRLVFITVILWFLILGLIDQIAHFALLSASVGSLSVFTFIASILFLIFVVGLIIIFFQKRQGIYDVFEAKYAKTSSSSSGPVGSSADPLDYWSYLEELFIEPEKQEEILPSLEKVEVKHEQAENKPEPAKKPAKKTANK